MAKEILVHKRYTIFIEVLKYKNANKGIK